MTDQPSSNSRTRRNIWLIFLALGIGVAEWQLYFFLKTDWLPRRVIQYGGYWLVLATVVLFAVVLGRELRADWKGWRVVAAHWPGLLLALLGAIFWQLHEPHDFKVIFDEHVLGGVARNMHYDREGAYRAFLHLREGEFDTLWSSVDKRPLLYPFLVSVAHDLTGYRPENSFLVNGILGFVLLGLVYGLGLVAGGRRVGYLGQLLLIGLPLLAQNATGGGFDLLNATVLCALLLAAWNYWRQPGVGGLDLLAMTGILYANVRYESLIYLGPIGVLAILKWLRERRVSLTLFSALTPALALPPMFVFKIFNFTPGNFQTSRSNFLNIDHVPENLTHAFDYLFQWNLDSTNSLLLSCVGAVALLLTVVAILGRLRTAATTASFDMPLILVLLTVLFTTAIMMFHFWGDWQRPEVSRFSLSLQMAFAWGAMFVAGQWSHGRQLPGCLLGGVGICAIVAASPASQRHTATSRCPSFLAYHWVRPYVLDRVDKNTLVITRANLLFTVCNQPNIPYLVANLVPEKVSNVLKLGLYRDVLVLQEMTLNRRFNTWVPYPPVRLDQRLILETIAEYPLNTGLIMRVSRVVGYDPNRPAGPLVLQGEVMDTEKLKTQIGWDYTGPPTNTAGMRTEPDETEHTVIESMSEIKDFFDLQRRMLEQDPQ